MSRICLSLLLFLTAAACGSTEIDSLPADATQTGQSDGGSQSGTDGSVTTTDGGGSTVTTDGGGGSQGGADAGLGAYADAEVQEEADGGCVPETCAAVASGCGPTEVCGDGADNNCNGQVDEGCRCSPGAVQRCFLGPPGRRGQGVCADGQQTCQGTGELGARWSACIGGISPSAEKCDKADNDCDGCKDDGLCCQGAGSCPSNNDPRVPVGQTFKPYTLSGTEFFSGEARSWQWKVEGGPCDLMLFASKKVVSYKVTGSDPRVDPRVASGQNLSFTPTLSGDYTITLSVTQPDGQVFSCTFIARIRQPGLRVETCWDTTGDDDVDLWVHRPNNTSGLWGRNSDTCYYANCKNSSALNWGYAPTANGACKDPVSGGCNNPRLDIDNQTTAGVPENINVDVPNNGDNFRVALNFYAKRSGDGDVHPMVNLYCGGELRATFGGAQIGETLYGSSAIAGFDTAHGDNSSGSLWRVADVLMQEPADTCTITPLVPAAGGSDACVDTSTDRSFDGPCAKQQ